MNSIKKLSRTAIIAIAVLSMSVPCFAQDISTANIPSEASEVSPRIVVSYEKEVRRYFTAVSGDSVPQSFYYSEWSDDYNTQCSGTLYLKHVTTVGTQIEATYRGTLVGHI